jgi:hypothetical protein
MSHQLDGRQLACGRLLQIIMQVVPWSAGMPWRTAVKIHIRPDHESTASDHMSLLDAAATGRRKAAFLLRDCKLATIMLTAAAALHVIALPATSH